MKTSWFVLAFAFTIAVASVTSASEKAKTEKPTMGQSVEKAKVSAVQPLASPKEKDVTVTGSYIKRDVKRNGMITDGPNHVLVIDERMIRNSGSLDLRQLLTHYGAGR